jgi:hypothetical protein
MHGFWCWCSVLRHRTERFADLLNLPDTYDCVLTCVYMCVRVCVYVCVNVCMYVYACMDARMYV